MKYLKHSNVVRILTSFVVEQDLWIVMSWLEAGSCAHIMKTIAPSGMKDEALIATILREVLNGLLYFHKDGRLHRDLKAGNVIISSAGEVQLADFGVAGTLMENGDRKKARKTFTGSVHTIHTYIHIYRLYVQLDIHSPLGYG
jgi:serine/threonine-protein kinase OSR1/STK39